MFNLIKMLEIQRSIAKDVIMTAFRYKNSPKKLAEFITLNRTYFDLSDEYIKIISELESEEILEEVPIFPPLEKLQKTNTISK